MNNTSKQKGSSEQQTESGISQSHRAALVWVDYIPVSPNRGYGEHFSKITKRRKLAREEWLMAVAQSSDARSFIAAALDAKTSRIAPKDSNNSKTPSPKASTLTTAITLSSLNTNRSGQEDGGEPS